MVRSKFWRPFLAIISVNLGNILMTFLMVRILLCGQKAIIFFVELSLFCRYLMVSRKFRGRSTRVFSHVLSRNLTGRNTGVHDVTSTSLCVLVLSQDGKAGFANQLLCIAKFRVELLHRPIRSKSLPLFGQPTSKMQILLAPWMLLYVK